MKRILLYVTCVLTVNAQTRVDLKSQAKSVDFTEAQSTRPIKTGMALPASCVTGDMYLMTSAPAGRNLFACTATNTWSMQAASDLPDMIGQANKVLVNDGTSSFWQDAAGDVIGGIASLFVTKLRGRPISSTPPTDGQVLIWDEAEGKWVPRGITLAQTADLTAKRTSATVLTIGETCTASTPCRVRVGTKERAFTTPATVAVLSGTGEIFVYITEERDLAVGYNGTLDLSCTACTTVPDVSAIPSSALALYRWTVSEEAGKWDAAGMDMRSILTSPAGVLPGTGIVVTDHPTNGSRVVSLNTSVALTKTAAQTGEALYCNASGTSSAYSCAMNPQLTGYTAGMTVHFRAHVPSGADATLNIDGLGARMLLRSDGSASSDGDFLSGGHYLLLYDGTAFRASGVVAPSPGGGSASSLDGMVPTRSSDTVLAVSSGGWRPGGLPGSNAFTAGNITALSGSGSVLWCLGTDQVYVATTGSLDVTVPAGTNDYGTAPGGACPEATIEWWRWQADDVVATWDATQTAADDKRYSVTTPAPMENSDTITWTRNSVTGAMVGETVGGLYNVFDRTREQWSDGFGFGTTTSGGIGERGWGLANISGASTTQPDVGETNHPGVTILSSANTADAGGCLAPSAAATDYYLNDFTADGVTRWEAIFKTHASITDGRFSTGFLPSAGTTLVGTSGYAANTIDRINIEFDQSDGDTVWKFRTCSGGTCTTQNSSVIVSADTWYHFKIESTTAGTIRFSVNGEAAVTQTGTMPTFDASPTICVGTNSILRSVYVDWAAFRRTGLTR